MTARRFILTLVLLAGCLTARGQELRTGVALDDGTFLAAGECLAWLDTNGNVLRLRPLDHPLTSLVIYKKRTYALDGAGRELLRLDRNGAVVGRDAPPVRGRLRALAGYRDLLWAVTDAGEILHGDGTGWTVLDFNDLYAGYYPRMEFRAIAAGGGSLMVAGVRPDGTPTVFTSARGTVWNERSLDYMEHGLPHAFTDAVSALSRDDAEDRFYLLGSGGALLSLPGCSHCNSLARYPVDTLHARIPAPSGTLLLGSGGFRKVEDN